ncbi:hypothetical protein CP061683_1192B, partial [Chlamydia psittaci 06-1683]
YIMNIGNIFSI